MLEEMETAPCPLLLLLLLLFAEELPAAAAEALEETSLDDLEERDLSLEEDFFSLDLEEDLRDLDDDDDGSGVPSAEVSPDGCRLGFLSLSPLGFLRPNMVME